MNHVGASEIDYVSAFILGLIQGVTEFLPVSSSGHLVLVQRWLGIRGDAPAVLLFDVLTHVGTLGAVFIVFWRSFFRFAAALARETEGSRRAKQTAWRVLLLALLACVPTGIIGLGLQKRFESAFDSPLAAGMGLLITGCVLFATGRIRRPRRGWRRFGIWRAVIVGIAQGIAIWPGISRSGSTIATAMFLGLKRRWSAEFSFLIAVPPIMGGALRKALDIWDLPGTVRTDVPLGPIALGTAVAFLVGIGALLLLLRLVVRDKLHLFAYYCWALAILVLIQARA